MKGRPGVRAAKMGVSVIRRANWGGRALACLVLGAIGAGAAPAAWSQSGPKSLAQIEDAYADFNDASGAISLIDSGLSANWDGRDRQAWAKIHDARLAQLDEALRKLDVSKLNAA